MLDDITESGLLTAQEYNQVNRQSLAPPPPPPDTTFLNNNSDNIFVTLKYKCFLNLFQEFQQRLDGQKPAVTNFIVAVNDLANRQGSTDNTSLVKRSHAIKQRYNRVCAQESVWKQELQIALVQCSDFSQTVCDLMEWLDTVQRRLESLEPVDILDHKSFLQTKYNMLQVFSSIQ